jgi:hypothetical protein
MSTLSPGESGTGMLQGTQKLIEFGMIHPEPYLGDRKFKKTLTVPNK